MKRIFALSLLVTVAFSGLCQKATGKLKFEQGQTLELNTNVTTAFAQQIMGQAIDFHVSGTAVHNYKVTNTTEDNHTLHHSMNQLSFRFDGMGNKVNFDSNNPKDMEGQFGKPIKEVLNKNYDIIIDPNGKVLMAQPEKIAAGNLDDRMRIIAEMLKDLTNLVQPPKKGEGSFFRVLPENNASIGESWSEKGTTDFGEFSNTYTLAEITDSTCIVNFTGISSATTKSELMGAETTTSLNNKSSGIIIVDKATGIVREKKFNTETTGTTLAMGNSLPFTSKTTTVITVGPGK